MNGSQKIFSVVLVFFLTTIFFSCSRTRNKFTTPNYIIADSLELEYYLSLYNDDPEDLNKLLPISNYYTANSQFSELLDLTVPFFENAIEKRDSLAMICSAGIIAQAYLFIDEITEVDKYLNYLSAFNLKPYPSIESQVHNIKGILYLKTSLNYKQSLKHFNKAYDIIDSVNIVTSNNFSILSNIVVIYCLRNDPTGISYAQEALSLIKRNPETPPNIEALIYLSMSKMHLIGNQIDSAQYYCNMADTSLRSIDIPDLLFSLRLQQGDIFAQKNEVSAAKKAYETALNSTLGAEPSLKANVLLNYGHLLLKEDEVYESIEMYKAGLEISYCYRNVEFRYELLEAIRKAYIQIGFADSVDRYSNLIVLFQDSINKVEKEREFNRLLFDQQRQQHISELTRKEIEFKKIRNITLTSLILLAVILWLNFNKKKKAQLESVIELEEKLSKHTRQETLNAEQDKDLFARFEDIMLRQKIYKQKDVSLEKVAELLSSNRTYLSKAIKNSANTNFSNYLNTLRINEAKEILSQKDFDIPIKHLADEVGYNSVTSLYRAFKKETGDTPSNFRNEVLNR